MSNIQNNYNNPAAYDLYWFSFLPRIIRLCVYKFAILPFSTFYERFFLNRFHNHAAGQGYLGCLQNYDISRAQESVKALKTLGGKEHFLIPKDREAKLQVIQLKVSEIKKKIEELGGFWGKEGSKIVIRGPKNENPEWKEYYENGLKQIFRNEIEENGSKVLVTSECAENIPFSVRTRKTDCILLARLGKSFAMSKFEISYFLGKGIDVCVYDTRGVLNSLGYPSEGGSYNDIDAVGDFLFKEQKYSPSKTCIFGSCGESFTAIYLFQKYHDQGINLFLQNAPDSLQSVISKVNVIARWIFSLYKGYIHAPQNSECSKTREDDFNSMKKIEGLKTRNKGYVILAKTLGDEMAPTSEVDTMANKFKEKGSCVLLLENRAEDSRARLNHTDPHLAHPLKNAKLQFSIHNQML